MRDVSSEVRPYHHGDLPRALLAVVVGAVLGAAGAAMQGYLRNPLSDPGLFGISPGAACRPEAFLLNSISPSTSTSKTPPEDGTSVSSVMSMLCSASSSAVRPTARSSYPQLVQYVIRIRIACSIA